MDLKQFADTDDRGVSPVIGVILMVAITVILAAVIATFVMNMGPPENTAPNTQIDITNETNAIIISHAGGDAITADEISIKVNDTEHDLTSAGFASGEDWTASSQNINISSGGNISVAPPNVDSVQVIWNNPSSDETQILKEFDS